MSYAAPQGKFRVIGVDLLSHEDYLVTTVRLKLEQNQLVGVFGEIGILVDALKGE
ncbi:MAG: hypothetical protein ACLPPV_15140 [Candidatus Korobacteraceae bacterium]|jgi:hypothetical protein